MVSDYPNRARGEIPPGEEGKHELNTLVIENESLRQGFTATPNYILRNPVISVGAKMTYILLLSYAWQEGSCFPGQDKLATDLGTSKRSIINWLQELEKGKLIKKERRGLGKTNVYIILDYKPLNGPKPPKLKGSNPPRSAKSAHQELPNLHIEKDTIEKDSESIVNEDINNNNSSGDPDSQNNVVVALSEKGISKTVATRLASRYNKDRIFEKIESLTFLQETHPDQVKKNPAGWLRRAIEENYAKPAGFLSTADREAQAKERERQQQENDHLEAAQMTQVAADREKQTKLRTDHLTAMLDHYNTSETETTLWQKTLTRLEATDTVRAKTYLAGSHLLTLNNGQAIIWFPHHFALREAEHHFTLTIQRLLAHHLNLTFDDLKLTFIAPDDPH